MGVVVLVAAFSLVGVGAIGSRNGVRAETAAPNAPSCAPSSPAVTRLTAAQVTDVGRAVQRDPLVKRLSGSTQLTISSGPRTAGIAVIPKASDVYGIGPTAMIVIITLPAGVPDGLQRWRWVTSGPDDACPDDPRRRVWSQEFDLDVSEIDGVDRRFVAAQVRISDLKVIQVVPQSIDPDVIRVRGPRTLLRPSR